MTQHFEEIASHLPFWDMSIPVIPPRSRLYNLSPIGLNTSLVESLTSYICRLASTHHVEVGTLIQYCIASVLGKHYIAECQSRSISSFLRNANPINGNGIMSYDWVNALETLTLRTGLAFLTLLVGKNALSQRQLLQPVRQWCPTCYEAWRRQDAIIYEPLLWSINGIIVCPEHCELLERSCPYCSSSLPWLTWGSLPGYCSFCGSWLGKYNYNSQVQNKDKFIAETVGDFLAHMPQLSLPIPREGVTKSLREMIAATAEGNMAAFSRNLGLSKTTLWELVQGNFPPSLPFLLQLCYQFRLPLLQVLTGVEHITSGEAPVFQELTQRCEVRRPFDCEKVRQALEVILADQQSEPLSMREIARRLCYPVRTIETHCPIQCQKISLRYAAFRKQLGQRRKAFLRERITEAARIILVQGEKLTYQRVGSMLGDPGCFREYEARRVLLDIRCRTDTEMSLE